MKKEFQLEENKDKYTGVTNLWLKPDGSVELGQTDGLPVKTYKSTWSILETAGEDDKPFRMTLDRAYSYGTHTGDNNVGEFDYHVQRVSCARLTIFRFLLSYTLSRP